jgi:hypothetical protein
MVLGDHGPGFSEPDRDGYGCSVLFDQEDKRGRDAAANQEPLVSAYRLVSLRGRVRTRLGVRRDHREPTVKAAIFGATLGAALWAMGVIKRRRR